MIVLELALSSAGHQFPPLSKLVTSGPHPGFPMRIRTNTSGFSIAILDVTLATEGAIYLIEANGSNGGLTSVATGHDEVRATHMALSFESKSQQKQPRVVLLPFKPGFVHLAEFFARAELFTMQISKIHQTCLRLSNDQLGTEEVSIVCGSIPALADRIERQGSQLVYRTRPVVFACNPNLLPELVRRSVIEVLDGRYNVDIDFFHEERLAPLIHEKGAQQVVAEGTGITPLAHSLAWSFEECLSIIRGFHERGNVAVGKMNAGSGGEGIGFFPPALGVAAINRKLRDVFRSAESSHGRAVAKTIFPIRFFEFARSSDFLLNRRPHLWDLRMECLIYPDFVEVMPCLFRICPAPFVDMKYNRDSVVSNLTGRKPSLDFVRSAFDNAAWEVLGIDFHVLRRIATSCARWCESAWKWSSVARSQSTTATSAGTGRTT